LKWGLSLSPLRGRDSGFSSVSFPQSRIGGESSLRDFQKSWYLNEGHPSPPQRGEAFRPLNPLSVILDSAAFFAGIAVLFPEVYTTPNVLKEVRDRASQNLLDLAQASGKIKVISPSAFSVREVKRAMDSIGESTLSETDVVVAAIAYELRPSITFTDDYSLQNLLAKMGLEFRPVRTEGISGVRSFRYKCSSCGTVFRKYVEICPKCGGRIRKVWKVD